MSAIHRAGKIIAVLCHATCGLLIVQGRSRPHAVRDGLLITGRQQYSGRAAARLVVEALGR